MSTEGKMRTSALSWGAAALVVSILSNLILINICREYYSILNSAGLMSSRGDSRGGLWEIDIIIPLLAIVAAAGGITAAKFKTSKRLAVISSCIGVAGWCLSLVLVHFIRTSLR